jgi:hypothetical protein
MVLRVIVVLSVRDERLPEEERRCLSLWGTNFVGQTSNLSSEYGKMVKDSSVVDGGTPTRATRAWMRVAMKIAMKVAILAIRSELS